jgi:uncharacterized membrane protein (DUF441 family)
MVIASTQGALTPRERVMQVLGLSGGDASLNTSASRWDTIVAGWQGFLARPLTGRGLDNASSVVMPQLSVHNLPVAALYQGGALFATGIVICVVMAVALVGRYRRDSMLSARIFSVMVAAVAFAATAPSFYNRYMWVPLAIGVASAVSALAERRAPGGPESVERAGS